MALAQPLPAAELLRHLGFAACPGFLAQQADARVQARALVPEVSAMVVFIETARAGLVPGGGGRPAHGRAPRRGRRLLGPDPARMARRLSIASSADASRFEVTPHRAPGPGSEPPQTPETR